MLEHEPAHDLGQAGELRFDRARRVTQGDGRRRVEHVRAGQPEVEPPALGSEPLGHRAQEGDDVVLRLAFDLVGSRRVDLDPDGAQPLPVVLGDHALGVERLGRQQLDPQPQLELAALTPELAKLGKRVAVDHASSIGRAGMPRRHARGSICTSARAACSVRNASTRSASSASDRARILAARCPAFFAPAEPMATVATGTPGGIWTIA